jgi:large subunit ribosomal protein L9
MKQQLLLLQDVPKLGRKGDIVTAKPGFIRNYLLPKQKAVTANKGALRMRVRLQEERAEQAAVDKVESVKLAEVINGKSLSVEVKIDSAGHLYGSVSANDIVRILSEEGVDIEKQHVALVKPIKKIGAYDISLVLSEGVPTSFTLEVMGEGGVKEILAVKEPVQEETSEEGAEENAEEESGEE